MSVHLFREIDHLRKALQGLSAMVEENLHDAILAALERDRERALRVMTREHKIDQREVNVEEECLKALALYQPVAHDLRYVIAILKITHDLERVGDLAADIAGCTLVLTESRQVEMDFGLPAPAVRVQAMLRRSLEALLTCDAGLAKEIWLDDDSVNAINRHAIAEMEQQIQLRPECLRGLLALIAISRSLDRIADHSTNICKDVIYMVDGEIVRHRSHVLRGQPPPAPA